MTRIAVALLLALSIPVAVRAHEIGTTQLAIDVRADGSYQLDVIIDPDALLTKLELAADLIPSSNIASAERDRRIEALRGVFVDRVHIRFDDIPVRSTFERLQSSTDSTRPSVVTLTGRAPAGVRTVAIGYGLAVGTFAVTVRLPNGETQTLWLDGAEQSRGILLDPTRRISARARIAWQYFALGYTHILPNGVDHVLFVLGIFLLSVRLRFILLQVSVFTIAHSITLGLTMYGVVSLPSRVVEPLIALSIAYVAVENLFTKQLKSWRVALVFSFGLLHGMGFAGVLRELGLPRSEFLTALLTFNAGVEVGQLTVIALAFAGLAYWQRKELTYRRFVVQPASIAIALVGLYWTLQRIAS
ncbi:MAG TPA: HupE/UreJ family protein [Vicinamibacterales bacterium]|nr:HupE/UreJ family protein [Vicinamibacterales bacterium]